MAETIAFASLNASLRANIRAYFPANGKLYVSILGHPRPRSHAHTFQLKVLLVGECRERWTEEGIESQRTDAKSRYSVGRHWLRLAHSSFNSGSFFPDR